MDTLPVPHCQADAPLAGTCLAMRPDGTISAFSCLFSYRVDRKEIHLLPYPLDDLQHKVKPSDLHAFSFSHEFEIPRCLHGDECTVAVESGSTLLRCARNNLSRCNYSVDLKTLVQNPNLSCAKYPTRSTINPAALCESGTEDSTSLRSEEAMSTDSDGSLGSFIVTDTDGDLSSYVPTTGNSSRGSNENTNTTSSNSSNSPEEMDIISFAPLASIVPLASGLSDSSLEPDRNLINPRTLASTLSSKYNKNDPVKALLESVALAFEGKKESTDIGTASASKRNLIESPISKRIHDLQTKDKASSSPCSPQRLIPNHAFRGIARSKLVSMYTAHNDGK
ncbi:hypothetical protein FA15DRAFT_660096 [Coprinopsis marcescibilis]|uniref:Uncharacterized protein n=1 Tax=Coprinopsis marcescibilis TaxID=230819 RepID=A0A5C3KGB6_COPMA|nr:hypothetical protein FA15DRAFT_660096 [Coprinopsis marcescibilis]